MLYLSVDGAPWACGWRPREEADAVPLLYLDGSDIRIGNNWKAATTQQETLRTTASPPVETHVNQAWYMAVCALDRALLWSRGSFYCLSCPCSIDCVFFIRLQSACADIPDTQVIKNSSDFWLSQNAVLPLLLRAYKSVFILLSY